MESEQSLSSASDGKFDPIVHVLTIINSIIFLETEEDSVWNRVLLEIQIPSGRSDVKHRSQLEQDPVRRKGERAGGRTERQVQKKSFTSYRTPVDTRIFQLQNNSWQIRLQYTRVSFCFCFWFFLRNLFTFFTQPCNLHPF